MASLVSPGVSVTVTDESFFIPAAARTVPLIFVATADEKKQPDNVTMAAGTYEHNVIRTVTSLKQSTELYGIPRFITDSSGNPHHGDARNEYGVFALNQYLGVGNLAYVIRANVNLNDTLTSLRAMWDASLSEATVVLENLVSAYINEYNRSNGFIPSAANAINTLGTIVGGSGYTDGTYTGVPLTGGSGTGALATITVAGGVVTVVTLTAGGLGYTVGNTLSASAAIIGVGGTLFSVPVATLSGYKLTVTGAELTDLTETAMQQVWDKSSFSTLHADFMNDHTLNPLEMYPNGYGNPAVGSYLGFAGIVADWELTGPGLTVSDEWTAAEAGNTLAGAGDDFKFTLEFYNKTSLGANDAARRVSIVTALQSSINSNTDIRSDTYDYNIVLCPGYHEVADELLALAQDVQDEILVLSDTPFDKDPDDVVTWAATSARKHSTAVSYHYPHCLASNLDGKNVFAASTGMVLRTITYSDEVSELWFAPAGTRRGLVTGVSQVGYVSGTLGTPTTFVESALNLGQRDNLYKYPTNVNPVVFFPGRGILVWGQKTSPVDASALDRINVSRLVMYIKRQLRKNTMSFVFEPNDQLTRDNIKAVVDGFLGDLIVKRGLYDFASVCDESNNTPDRIDRNELYVDIALKPVKAAEFIYIPIRVIATGAEL